MKKGISIWTFPDRTPDVCFALAKKYGFDGVEVGLGKTGPVRYDSTREEIEEYRKIGESYGMSFYSLVCDDCWENSLTSDNADTRKKAEEIIIKQLEIASWLGCDTILILPGMLDCDGGKSIVPYDVAYERAVEEVRKLAVYAEKYGVVLGIENVWNKFLLSPLEMRNFIDEVGSPWVKAYFDVGNVVYIGYPQHWIKALGKRIKKVHFKDYRVEAGGLCGFVDLLAGDVNYPAVMDEFKKIRYDGWVTGEMLPPYTYYPEQIIYNTSKSMDKIIGRK